MSFKNIYSQQYKTYLTEYIKILRLYTKWAKSNINNKNGMRKKKNNFFNFKLEILKEKNCKLK